MSGGSTACVKFQSWGKFLALNTRCFVVNWLSVVISRSFLLNMVGNMRVKFGVKKVRIVIVLIPCGIKE